MAGVSSVPTAPSAVVVAAGMPNLMRTEWIKPGGVSHMTIIMLLKDNTVRVAKLVHNI